MKISIENQFIINEMKIVLDCECDKMFKLVEMLSERRRNKLHVGL